MTSPARGHTESPTLDTADLEEFRASIARVTQELCDSTALHACIDGRGDLAEKVWTTASELGWLGIEIPESCGGLALGVRASVTLHEELGFKAAPGSFIACSVFAGAMAELGSEELKQRYLPRLCRGELKVAIPAVMQSPESSAPSDRSWLLGDAAASVALLPRGEQWVVAELAAATNVRIPMWDHTRSMFSIGNQEAALMPAQALKAGTLIGERFALAVAADSLGGARSIALSTLDYLKQRAQFGKPVATFQALKHRMANIYALISTVEHVVAQAAERVHQRSSDAWMWAALAKAEATDAFSWIASDCVLLHGGVGFTWEYDPHIYVKRARLNEALVMSNGVLRDRAERQLSAFMRDGKTTMDISTS